MHVLILGGSGMLGNALLRLFQSSPSFRITTTLRSVHSLSTSLVDPITTVISNVDVANTAALRSLIEKVRPDVVINCIGVIKQMACANEALSVIPINSLLPHMLANICVDIGARLIHISTDCVFSGTHGMYTEDSFPDAGDLYGRSKLLGEVDYPHAVTLRTSIIGHELNSARSLINWFLSQDGNVRGFRNAFFSGLPTVELARVIQDFVIPNPSLSGLYHVSSERISKYDLLNLVAKEYKKNILVIPSDEYKIDRSLDSSRFRAATGFKPKSWPTMIHAMHEFK